MNALIENAAVEILAVFGRMAPAVAVLNAHALHELEHRCEDLERDAEFSVRTGAHIVRAAVLMELERRKSS